MRRILLLSFTSLLAGRAAIQGEAAPGPAARATAIAGEFQRGDMDSVFARFDDTMKGALPRPKLEQVFQSLQGQVGALRSCGEPQVQSAGPLEIALVPCTFDKASLTLKVAFAADGRIAGLFFLPGSPSASWATPAYVGPGSTSESEIVVGGGEWALPGTLAMPASRGGPVPAVVLVHGSGPHDRDETIGANKPFKDLALGLSSRGVAVLRYEKRTQAHAAKLVSMKKFTVREETIDDALLAAALLRKTPGVDPRRIVVLGHSLGGMLIPRIGKADPELAGLVCLAGNVRPIEELLAEQADYISSLRSTTEESRKQLETMKREAARAAALERGSVAEDAMILNAPASYWLDLKGYRPAEEARALRQPLLILQGERDYQVTMKDFGLWKAALSGRAGVVFKSYPKLNHLFAEGEGRATPAEYEKTEHVAEAVVLDIAKWVLGLPPAGPTRP